ncbi:hypothetical protein Tco_0899496 [Tanacetum coccineum]
MPTLVGVRRRMSSYLKSSNLSSNKADFSGSLFWNVGSSSLSTTHIVEKIDKIEKLIIDGQVTLVDDEDKPMEKVDYLGDHDSEDEMESTVNDMANFIALEKVFLGKGFPRSLQRR